MSTTGAHSPAYIRDTHVKWSGARGYMHTLHTCFMPVTRMQAHARADTRRQIQTANKQRRNERQQQQQLCWPLSRVLLVEKRRQQSQ